VLFDLFSGLLDSQPAYDEVAGSASLGGRWRREHSRLSYLAGDYRPHDDLVAEAAKRIGLPQIVHGRLLPGWGRGNEVSAERAKESARRSDVLLSRVPSSAEIVPGVWRVGGGSWGGTVEAVSAEEDANVYLLQLNGCEVMVDCGTRGGLDDILRTLRSLGREPDALTDLLLTHSHWDHMDAAARWQGSLRGLRTHLNRIGAQFLARGDHRLVGYQLREPGYEFEPFRLDHEVEDGETFELGRTRITSKFLPGHTPDSTLYTLEIERQVIGISGDLMFAPRAGEQVVLGQLCTLWLSNLDDYVCSLRSLEGVPIDVLLPGHGDAIVGSTRVSEVLRETLALAESLAADERVRANARI
jgi:glyoxylase-like metal-dependent hydrolase (beta-lactamase superfamily II)